MADVARAGRGKDARVPVVLAGMVVIAPVLQGKCPERFCSRARAEAGKVILSHDEGLVFGKNACDAVPVVVRPVEFYVIVGGLHLLDCCEDRSSLGVRINKKSQWRDVTLSRMG